MAASLGHALAVRVEEGRHFPRDGGAAFRVAATFDDEPRTSVRRPPPQQRVSRHAHRARAYNHQHMRAPDAARHHCAQAFARPSVTPFWGATLSWEVDPERLRRVSATGTGQLKLTGACAGCCAPRAGRSRGSADRQP